MNETKNGEGQRKVRTTYLYTAFVFILGGALLYLGKIEGGQYVNMVESAGWVTVAFITGNVVKGGVQAIVNRGVK